MKAAPPSYEVLEHRLSKANRAHAVIAARHDQLLKENAALQEKVHRQAWTIVALREAVYSRGKMSSRLSGTLSPSLPVAENSLPGYRRATKASKGRDRAASQIDVTPNLKSQSIPRSPVDRPSTPHYASATESSERRRHATCGGELLIDVEDPWDCEVSPWKVDSSDFTALRHARPSSPPGIEPHQKTCDCQYCNQAISLQELQDTKRFLNLPFRAERLYLDAADQYRFRETALNSAARALWNALSREWPDTCYYYYPLGWQSISFGTEDLIPCFGFHSRREAEERERIGGCTPGWMMYNMIYRMRDLRNSHMHRNTVTCEILDYLVRDAHLLVCVLGDEAEATRINEIRKEIRELAESEHQGLVNLLECDILAQTNPGSMPILYQKFFSDFWKKQPCDGWHPLVKAYIEEWGRLRRRIGDHDPLTIAYRQRVERENRPASEQQLETEAEPAENTGWWRPPSDFGETQVDLPTTLESQCVKEDQIPEKSDRKRLLEAALAEPRPLCQRRASWSI